MIVELFGCPGSGKTSVINKVRGTGNIGIVTENRIKSYIITGIKRMSLFAPTSLSLRRRIHRCLDKSTYRAKYIDKSLDNFLDKVVMLAFGYKYLINKKIYMDEGIVHRIVSIAVNFGISNEILLQMIDIFSSYLKSVQVFYLDVDIDVCLQGIYDRNRHECEMDKLDGIKLKEYLEDYKRYFDLVYTKYGYTRITRDDYRVLEEMVK